MTTLADEKQCLRHAMRRLKAALTPDERARQSASVVEQLRREPLFVAARCVMFYWPLPDEVDICPLIDEALRNKRVILPVVVGDDMLPVELTATTVWRRGAFGIMEPQGSPCTEPIDLIVVPGVAFDAAGHRMGRGRGYYDRFLAAMPQVPTIGVAFDFQMVPHVPYDRYDVPMHKVLVSYTTPKSTNPPKGGR